MSAEAWWLITVQPDRCNWYGRTMWSSAHFGRWKEDGEVKTEGRNLCTDRIGRVSYSRAIREIMVPVIYLSAESLNRNTEQIRTITPVITPR